MGHKSALSELREFLNKQLESLNPSEQVRHLKSESDRSAMILHAAHVEQSLFWALKQQMVDINNKEKERLFGYGGPLGTFSSRILLAHGLGIIERPIRRKIAIIEEIRNTAAHAHDKLQFDTPEIKNAVSAIFGTQDAFEVRSWPKNDVRLAFGMSCTLIAHCVFNPDKFVKFDGLLDSIKDVQARRE